MADVLTQVTGVPVGTPQITKEIFYSDAHKQALGEEYWAATHTSKAWRDIEASKQVVPNPMTMEVWARQSSELRKLLGI
ncbi:hypothetical protein L198_06713 [Cryptococcus wingfieldii CBS 7118]|uniref:NmrA-like domain-containing protein n=1 Tax=Cryptococcus wingfieldii CBS 7118 TaxID=1295528 RepID=A0A1E3IL57_9TREE|nr:hypothetical protein L198_06713 [Cryptococcus wingfieldii CBS 7118]ODN88441.1 hypothetical protein L198_06713 [Cryptococcus wingfieldii CBS 7118]